MARNTTDLTDDLLTAKQRAFVGEYLKDRDPEQAAIRAGYSKRSAFSYGTGLLRNKLVAHEIQIIDARVLELVQVNTGINLERTLREIARGAFFDVRKLFNPDGSPKDITELDDDTASAIEGIEVIEQFSGNGENRVFTGNVKKYKLARRASSLDMLMKHLNGYDADNKGKGEGAVNALITLLLEMKRSSLPIVYEVPRDDNL